MKDRLQISERSEKARKLAALSHTSHGLGQWAWPCKWADGDHGPADFDDSAECWRGEAGRAWEAESPARRMGLVAGAVVCGALTVGWVGWVVWMVCSKG